MSFERKLAMNAQHIAIEKYVTYLLIWSSLPSALATLAKSSILGLYSSPNGLKN
ncbi:MAG: hypothetical protein P4L49_14960 [Desulfosporosinus sp.]|nr:hypothetical protein [Desulfosporosinus sp.]